MLHGPGLVTVWGTAPYAPPGCCRSSPLLQAAALVGLVGVLLSLSPCSLTPFFSFRLNSA